MTDIKQRIAAKKFATDWEGKGYEKGQSQPFWLSLLRDVLGVEQPEQFITFEDKVMLDHTSFIDGRIPSTHVLIEQKSIDKDLDAPIKQSNGSLLTPFQQAKQYSMELPYSQRPRWIVTSNFASFRIYDMEQPAAPPEVVLLENLADEVHRLRFLVDKGDTHVRRELELSIQAGEIVGRIYDYLREQYIDPDSPESQHSLNVLCVRLVFLLYSESAGILGHHGIFGDYLRAHADHARDALIKLFEVLDQPENERDPYLDDDIAAFPYVNGGLFRDKVEIPKLTPEIVDLILHRASEGFKWRDISPTIFGSIFESTLNPQTRREGGMHYTSIENIHKVIDPLFLDDLQAELDKAKGLKTENARKKNLTKFREKLASLKFLDPACGSGNFLTETYLCLRRFENEAIRTLAHDQIAWEAANPIQVSISQFYGIEINDFAATVARTAMWIAEGQMFLETLSILAMEIDYLPLTTAANIVEGNALRMDWNDVVPASELSYIMGNPPFTGYAYQTQEQKSDLRSLGNSFKGTIDYVAGWYVKASEYMQGTQIRAAFVSTNSITQGEQVAAIWKPLVEDLNVHIDFAWPTFIWDSETNKKAHVHVVIVGFSTAPNAQKPRIYTSQAYRDVQCISPYLLEGSTMFIERRRVPAAGVPQMMRGNQPTDGGNFILTETEKNALLSAEPQAAPFVRPFMMGKDFIKRQPRYCLWLLGADPAVLRKCPEVMQRVERVREYRSHSKKAATRAKAATPTLFDETKVMSSSYVALPKVSSERRNYIPIDYLEQDVVPGDQLFVVSDSTLYHFGVLTSIVHMAWMRVVTGRLKSDYRYSNTLVYNNFPWPDPMPKQKAAIEKTAQAILDARALYPTCSLADLYDEDTMPPELRKAHSENDRAVMRAYGMKPGMSEAECVARLMWMYQDLTTGEA